MNELMSLDTVEDPEVNWIKAWFYSLTLGRAVTVFGSFALTMACLENLRFVAINTRHSVGHTMLTYLPMVLYVLYISEFYAFTDLAK